MAAKFVIQSILDERNRLLLEKQRAIERFDSLIQECITSIEILEGKKVWEVEQAMKYDDESPDYIKSSIEE